MCVGHFFDKVIRIGARIFAFLNIAIIGICMVYFVPENWPKGEVFVELLKSKGIDYSVDDFFYILLSLALVSSILLFVLRCRTKARVNIWLLLLINIYIICNCMLSVIDGEERRLRGAFKLADIGILNAIMSFVDFDFDMMSFLIYFVLFLFNSVFLWRMSGKGLERETN